MNRISGFQFYVTVMCGDCKNPKYAAKVQTKFLLHIQKAQNRTHSFDDFVRKKARYRLFFFNEVAHFLSLDKFAYTTWYLAKGHDILRF
jgi:hypothetical protein